MYCEFVNIKVTLVVIQVKKAVKFVVLVALLIMILLVALVYSVLRFLFFYFLNQYDMRAPNDLEFIEQCVNLKELLDCLCG